jgi:DNA-binding LytR/AlgR family response regulator
MTRRKLRGALKTIGLNAAAALFAVVAFGGASFGGSWRAALLNFGVSFLFANCIGIPLSLTMSALGPRVWPRFGFPLNWIVLVATMVGIAIAGSALAISLLLVGGAIERSSFAGWFIGSIRVSLLATLTFGISVMMYEGMRRRLEQTTLELRTKERDEAEARRLAAQAHLAALEARVQPHFLFNTLNSIAALIPVNPAGAERVVGQLSSLLRASLDSSRAPLVPLADELKLARDYLEIERVRFGERLRYELTDAAGLTGVLVPRMAVQTLVENCVKYAVTSRREGASIVVRAVRTTERLRAYIVDDEQLAVDRLTRLLQATGRVEIVGATTDPDEASLFLRATPVDVLFLDIQMPGMSGFELISSLERDVRIIFTTAFDEFALQAFSVDSIDYLLKPIEPQRLEQALDKLERFSGHPGPDVKSLARELAAQLTPGRRLDRIASRVGDRTTVLDVGRVTHFAARDKLTYAVVNGREHVIDLALSDLEGRLDPRRFVRIHRATIVNVSYVSELDAWIDGGVLVRLKDDAKTELSVGRDRVRALKSRLLSGAT